MSSRRVFGVGALVVVALVTASAVGAWRDLCRGLNPESAEGVPGCSLFVSGPSVDVTFPEDWQVGEISPSVYREVQRAAMPANIALGGGAWVSAVVVGWDEEVRSGCVAIAAQEIEGDGSIPRFIYPPEVGRNIVLHAAGRTVPSGGEGVSWLPAESDELTLPAGAASRVVHDLPEGRSGTQYSVNDGEWALILACHADSTPPDRWLSIAQTLDLLPDG